MARQGTFLIIILAFLLGCTGVGLNSSAIQAFVRYWFTIGGGFNPGSYPQLVTANGQFLLVDADQAGGINTYSFSGGTMPGWSSPISPNFGKTGGAPVSNISTANVGSSLYATWTEGTSPSRKNYIATFSGGWLFLNGANTIDNTIHDGAETSLATLGGKVYAIWDEDVNNNLLNQVQFGVLDPSVPSWTPLNAGSTLNVNALTPATAPQIVSYNGKIYGTWTETNSFVTPSQVDTTAMATDSGNQKYLAYDDSTGHVSVMTMGGQQQSNWFPLGHLNFASTLVGNGIAIAVAQGIPYVAFADAGSPHQLDVMKFVNNSWLSIGSALSVGTAQKPAIFADAAGNVTVAFQDSSDGGVYIRRFNGSWGSQVLQTTHGAFPAFVSDHFNDLYLAYQDQNSSSHAVVVLVNGSPSNPCTAATLSSGIATNMVAASDSNNIYLGFSDSGAAGKFQLVTCSISTGVWSGASAPVGLSTDSAVSLAASGGSVYAGFTDSSAGFEIFSYNGSWSGPVLLSPHQGLSSGMTADSSGPYVAYVDSQPSPPAQVLHSAFFNGSAWNEIYNPTPQVRAAVYNSLSNQWIYIDSVQTTGGVIGGNFGINRCPSCAAKLSSATVFQNRVYIAWWESQSAGSGGPYVAHVTVYNGNDASPNGQMVDVGGLNYNPSLSVATTAVTPVSLSTFFNRLYATWSEQASDGSLAVRVKVYSGSDGAPAWTFIDGNGPDGLNMNPSPTTFGMWPSFGTYAGNYYITWVQSASVSTAGSITVSEGQ